MLRGLAPYFEVFSYHSYTPQAPRQALERTARLTGKPTMVTEFSFNGLVKIDGAPWEILTTRMKEVNAGLEELAARAAQR